MNIGLCFIGAIACVIALCSACPAGSTVIVRPTNLPKTTPWNLDELSQAPQFTWGPGTTVRSLLYEGEMYRGKRSQVFAYYTTPGLLKGDPSLDRALPAIVLVHGGGGKAFKEWVKLWASRGFAAIAMDLAGCGEKGKRLASGGPGQEHDTKFEAIDQPVTEQWTYHAVANVIRAHSLLLSFEAVDGERTALTGISWGGYTTCIVAGLDNRFKAAVPVYGCGYVFENPRWIPDLEKMSAEHRAKWIRLWDPSRYVGLASMPMLFVTGGKDGAYPPDCHAKTFGLVRSPKNLHFVPQMRHAHIFDRPAAIELFIREKLSGGTPLPIVLTPRLDEQGVIAKVVTETKLKTAALYFTTAPIPGDVKTRKWHRHLARIDGDRLYAPQPPAETTAWFLTVRDERNALVSSELAFPNRDPKVQR